MVKVVAAPERAQLAGHIARKRDDLATLARHQAWREWVVTSGGGREVFRWLREPAQRSPEPFDSSLTPTGPQTCVYSPAQEDGAIWSHNEIPCETTQWFTQYAHTLPAISEEDVREAAMAFSPSRAGGS